MLMPTKVKHRKQHRGRMTGHAKGGTEVTFGDYGIQALEPGWITARQIEAARIAMTRHIKRGGKVWINVFPDKPVTEKPAETRMGSGKGNPEHWVAVVQAGPHPVRAVATPTRTSPSEAIDRAIQKLPIKARFVTREEGVLMAARPTELRDLDDAELVDELAEAKDRSCSTSASSTSPASSTTTPASAQAQARRRPHQHRAARRARSRPPKRRPRGDA